MNKKIFRDYDKPTRYQTVADAQDEKDEKYKKEYEKYKREVLDPQTEKMYADLREKYGPKKGGKKRRTRKNTKSKKVKKIKKVKKTMKYKRNTKSKKNNRRRV